MAEIQVSTMPGPQTIGWDNERIVQKHYNDSVCQAYRRAVVQGLIEAKELAPFEVVSIKAEIAKSTNIDDLAVDMEEGWMLIQFNHDIFLMSDNLSFRIKGFQFLVLPMAMPGF